MGDCGDANIEMQMNIYATLLGGSKRLVLLRAAILFVAIALLDWAVVGAIPLGFLYLIPMLLVGSALSPFQIVSIAALCTFMAEAFDDFAWAPRTGIPRDVLYFAAFTGGGLFIREISRSRHVALGHLREVEQQRDARREAEEQLKALIESSPAAILTADSDGVILTANEAAHRMLAVPPAALPGRTIYSYLPSLTNVSRHNGGRQLFRTVMQARGQREDGDSFLADIWFSTYRTNAGSRLTAMVIDASEELRNHEVSGLRQLMEGSRIAVGAVSHEIRNVCGAIAVVHTNLAKRGLLAGNEDFEALGNLVVALERIASVNLKQSTDKPAELDLAELLNELKIIVSPLLQDEEISLEWEVPAALPLVWADRSSLMQVFLNLITNSSRILAGKPQPRLTIRAKSEKTQVTVEISDNGGGVALPEHLFHPFQAGATSAGLGLFLSRGFMRSFGGDLRYKSLPEGACFLVELNAVLPAGRPSR
jgi:two-component system, LuxR family, sensor kinase FixL